MVKIILHIVTILLFVQVPFAQSAYSLVNKGNKEMKQKKYTDAEISYRKSLDKSQTEIIPVYNIGVSQYMQGNLEQAQSFFSNSAEKFEAKENRAHAYHNLGNSYLDAQKYEESIKAYKEALKLMPSDMDTKYNLAYAQLMLKKEQQQQEQQQNQEQQNKDEKSNKDEKEKDKQDQQNEEKDNQDKKDKEEKEGEENKQNRNKGEEKEEEQPSQPKETKLSKEQAEKLLKALENEESKLQEKLDKPEGEPVNVIIQKDW